MTQLGLVGITLPQSTLSDPEYPPSVWPAALTYAHRALGDSIQHYAGRGYLRHRSSQRPAGISDVINARRRRCRNILGGFDIAPSPTATLIPPNSETGPAAVTLNLRVSRVFGFGRETKEHGVEEGGGGDHGHYRRGRLGPRGLASGGGGPKGPSAERKYAITVTAEVQNLLNTENLWIPVSNRNSPLFGKSIALTGEPFSGEGDANRRIDLRLSFSF